MGLRNTITWKMSLWGMIVRLWWMIFWFWRVIFGLRGVIIWLW